MTTVLDIRPDLFWGLVALAGLVALTMGIYGVLSLVGTRRPSPVEQMREALGLKGLNRGLFFLALCLWTAIFLSLVTGLLWVIWSVIYTQPPGSGQAVWDWRFNLGQMVALTGVLGAVVALPFTLVRIRLTREQTAISDQQKRIADEALFNDKIKAAADDLHARRQIKRKSRLENPDEPDFIEDDIVRRVTAIDRLAGLAQERPAEAPRITRMLCVYLRHLSKGIGPDNKEHPRDDMLLAAQTIGRMKRIENVEPDEIEIDLRGANLAGFDLSGLCFDKALMSGAQMQGAKFTRTHLENGQFLEAQMQGSHLGGARLNGFTNFTGASLRGAAMRYVDFSEAFISQQQVGSAFGDQTVCLPETIARPPHWPEIDDTHRDGPDIPDIFVMEWRAWQKEIGFDPDDPATW